MEGGLAAQAAWKEQTGRRIKDSHCDWKATPATSIREVMDYTVINDKLDDLKSRGIINPLIGEAKEAVPVKIASVNKHALKHGVTMEEAQSYIYNAVVMFDQGNRSLYVSAEGNSVILDAEKRLISAYKKADFDPGIMAILEVVKNGKGI